MKFFKSESSFTLVELLIVIGIIAILATAVVVVLNPIEFLKQSRDSTRMSDLQSLNKAIEIYQTDGGLFFGANNTIYVSIPDSSATCANSSLPSLPTGWSYSCSDFNNYRKVDGNGWIPIDLTSISYGSILEILPIDPINSVSAGNYYTYVSGGSWKLTSLFESEKYAQNMNKDGGPDTGIYEIGTNLDLANFARGLIGYWKFDEGNGITASDSSGNDNTGALTNGPIWVSGKIGNALNFDGEDDYVNAGSGSSLKTAQGTWAVWMYHDGILDQCGILLIGDGGWNNNIAIQQGSSGAPNRIVVRARENGETFPYKWSGSTASASLPANQWNHIVLTQDGINPKIYINGNLVLTITSGGNLSVWTNASWLSAKIFGMARNIGRRFNGFLDEVRVYNRALSAAEISVIYNATKQ